MSFKQKIVAHCIQLVNTKILSLQNALRDLSEGAENDSKSSAGDKHETSRSMMQLEQEKIGRQLKDALEQKVQFEKIDTTITSSQIIKGSLVKTDSVYLFIAEALGRIKVDDIPVIVISPQSPLGKLLLRKKKNEAVELNGINHFIENIN